MKPELPPQITGKETVVHHIVHTRDEASAAMIFLAAKNRLCDVNNWKKMQQKSPFKSKILDKNGIPTDHNPETGDFIVIDIPGPGPKHGEGWDWVIIEEVMENGNPETEGQLYSFRVRPSPNPLSENNDTAHFFDTSATNTFSVERTGKQVIASVIGRNERSNTKAKGIFEKLRNATVAAGGVAGFSALTWKWLVKGLLK